MPRLVVGFEGKRPPPEVARLARRGVLAGVCVFARNFDTGAELRALCAEVHDLFAGEAGDGLAPIVSVDQEGGPVQRLKPPRTPDVAAVPAMRELGSRLDAAGFDALGERMGRELRGYGLNVDFAPVLDVDTNPANPVIGARAFGGTADEVIARALPFARGLMRAGVAACGKHFPGHGDTTVDSHVGLPRVDHDAARLEQVELAPFRAAVAAGLPMLMTAHVVFAAWDAERPATLSPRVVPEVLRRRFGFDGVVVSDDLDMAAVKGRHDVRAIARGLAAADVDLALVCQDLAFAEALAAELPASPAAERRVARLRQSLPFPRAAS